MSTTNSKTRIPTAEIVAAFKEIAVARDRAAGITDIADVTPQPAEPAPKKTRKPRKPAAAAAPQPAPAPSPAPAQPVLLLPARCLTSVQAEQRAARKAATSAARTAAVAAGRAAGAAATTAAIEALNAQRRALFAQHIPTQTLPETSRQSLYAKDLTEYKLTMSDPLSMTVIFKVSPSKKVVWFKLDGIYVRECIADGKPVHLTVFMQPPAAEAPAGAEALDFGAAA